MNKPSVNSGEGRAQRARPSLCLLWVLALLSVAAVAAPAAQAAAPPVPALTSTNPFSSEALPADSTEPLILGRADGSIISVVRSRVGGGPVIESAVNPSNEIEIFTNPTCSGGPVAVGSVGQLEGSGIPVKVASDTATTFYATQTEPAEPDEPSGCSQPGLTYWEGTTPVKEPPGEEPHPGEESPSSGGSTPPAAPHLRTIPGVRSNDSTPLVTGTAPEAARVKVFENANCSGAAVANGSATQLTSGFQVPVAENAATSFYAVAISSGGGQSACSAPVVYIEDSTPPRTRFTMAPGAKTRNRSPVFRFTDITEDPPNTTTFRCRVNRGKWKSCRAPFHLHHLRFRSYLLQVKGTDVAGNEEKLGAKRRFKVVRHP